MPSTGPHNPRQFGARFDAAGLTVERVTDLATGFRAFGLRSTSTG
jgi:hypothetical protein